MDARSTLALGHGKTRFSTGVLLSVDAILCQGTANRLLSADVVPPGGKPLSSDSPCMSFSSTSRDRRQRRAGPAIPNSALMILRRAVTLGPYAAGRATFAVGLEPRIFSPGDRLASIRQIRSFRQKAVGHEQRSIGVARVCTRAVDHASQQPAPIDPNDGCQLVVSWAGGEAQALSERAIRTRRLKIIWAALT